MVPDEINENIHINVAILDHLGENEALCGIHVKL